MKELGSPWPVAWQVQQAPAGRAGEPAGQVQQATPEGLGDHQVGGAQADDGDPTQQVVRERGDD